MRLYQLPMIESGLAQGGVEAEERKWKGGEAMFRQRWESGGICCAESRKSIHQVKTVMTIIF